MACRCQGEIDDGGSLRSYAWYPGSLACPLALLLRQSFAVSHVAADPHSRITPRITCELVDAILIVRLNRPEKLNAADLELQQQFTATIESAADRPELRALVLTGAGRAFCAGGDRSLAEAAGQGKLPHAGELAQLQRRTIRAMLSLPCPAIAAVNGPAVGYGASLVALCDLAVMGDDAFLSDPHVQYGIAASPPTAVIWPKLVGRAAAMDLLLSGRRVLAEEALRLGLVSRICPSGHEVEAAMEIARGYLELPAAGIAATRHMLNRTLLAEFEQMGMG